MSCASKVRSSTSIFFGVCKLMKSSEDPNVVDRENQFPSDDISWRVGFAADS